MKSQFNTFFQHMRNLFFSPRRAFLASSFIFSAALCSPALASSLVNKAIVAAPQAPVTALSPVGQDIVLNSIPQSYQQWFEEYKKHYSSLVCPGKCLWDSWAVVSYNEKSGLFTLSQTVEVFGAQRQPLMLPTLSAATGGVIAPALIEVVQASDKGQNGAKQTTSNLNPNSNSNSKGNYSIESLDNFSKRVNLTPGKWIVSQSWSYKDGFTGSIDFYSPYLNLLNEQNLALSTQSDKRRISFSSAILSASKNENADTAKPVVENSTKPGVVGDSAKTETNISVYRLFQDSLFSQLESIIRITNTSSTKEIDLAQVIPQGWVITSYSSAVPIKSVNGQIIVYAPPGQTQITINASSDKRVDKIKVSGLVKNATKEIWSIKNSQSGQAIYKNEVVINSSTQSVDPKSALVPSKWASTSAYIVTDTIEFKKTAINEISSNKSTIDIRRFSWVGFDESNKDKAIHLDDINFRTSVPDGMGEWVFSNKVKPIAATDLRTKEPQLLWKQGQAVAFNMQSGQQYRSMFESSDSEMEVWASEKSKQNTGDTQRISNWRVFLPPGESIIGYSGALQVQGSWVDLWNLYALFGLFFISFVFYKFFGLTLALVCAASIILNIENSFFAWSLWPTILILLMAQKATSPSNGVHSSLPSFVTFAIRLSGVFLIICLAFFSLSATTSELRRILNPSIDAVASEYYLRDFSQQRDYSNQAQAPRAKAQRQQMAMQERKEAGVASATSGDAMISMPSAPSAAGSASDTTDTGVISEQLNLGVANSNLGTTEQRVYSAQNQSFTNTTLNKNQVEVGLPKWVGRSYLVTPKSSIRGEAEGSVKLYIASSTARALASLAQLVVLWLTTAALVVLVFNKQKLVKDAVKKVQHKVSEIKNRIKKAQGARK